MEESLLYRYPVEKKRMSTNQTVRTSTLYTALKKTIVGACRAKGVEISSTEAGRIVNNAVSRIAQDKVAQFTLECLEPQIEEICTAVMAAVNTNAEGTGYTFSFPPGTKLYHRNGPHHFIITEQKPHMRIIRAGGPYGNGEFHVSMPHTVFITQFVEQNGQLRWYAPLHVAFRVEPLRDVGDMLCYTPFGNMQALRTGCFPIQSPPSTWSLAQQVAYVIEKYFQTTFTYYQNDLDATRMKEMGNYDGWQKKSAKDKLYGLKVNWKEYMPLGKYLAQMGTGYDPELFEFDNDKKQWVPKKSTKSKPMQNKAVKQMVGNTKKRASKVIDKQVRQMVDRLVAEIKKI